MRAEQRGVVGGRFVLEHRAGAGGMGEVYKAKDTETGLSVAVKIMRDGSDDDATRFMREARILSELEHSRIVRHVAHGVTDAGAPWLAMEWLDGEDLSTRLSRGRLTLAESLRLALNVADGLAFAHARNVVHRDLKPSNLFLRNGQTDDVCILDFGIAKLGFTTRVTRTGMLVGTPGYMAPEQARGELTMDARVDVYSLGSVLFECLTGESLYSGAHAVALLAKILFEDAPRVRDKLPEVPAMIDDIVAKMLSKDARERFEDGKALAAALRSLDISNLRALDPRRPSSRPALRSLTNAEKRSVAVILIGADSSAPIDVLAPTNLQPPESSEIRAEAEAYGGRCESLLNGSVAILMTQKTLASDLAAQAARCALALRKRVPGRNVVLAMGRADATDKSPMGHVIDRAASLSGASRAIDAFVWIDDTVAGLLDARFDVREEGEAFVLHHERALGEGTRTLLGRATPLVGREREIRYIEDCFEESLEGNAQAVLVTAPAGVGKSRLGHEFLRTVRDRTDEVAIWIARGDALRAGSALGLLAQALRSVCGIVDGESLEVRREKVRREVAERIVEADRKRVTEFLGELIGTTFPDSDSLPLRSARLDAQLMTDQMRAAFLDFINVECAKRPVLILLEDLHWGDRPTIQFIDFALRELYDKPIFVLALGRPDVRETFPDLWTHRKLVEVHLKELGRRPIERLIRHALGDNISHETIERFVRLSEGNAFYLEELIRFNAEGRAGELPDTVVAMVQSRLGTLDEMARRLLRGAAVFGEVSWTGGVAALMGDIERRVVQEGLSQLAESELLIKRRQSRFLNEDEYAFRHALLREGAYGMLTEGDRALGHKLAALWLEASGEDDALLLADHFENGGDAERAAHHYERAATRAYLSGDSAAAVVHAKRGLACVSAPESRVELLGVLCLAHFWQLEHLAAAHPYADEVLRIAPHGSVPWLWGMLIRQNGALMRGDIEQFDAAVEELMTIEPSTGHACGSLIFTLATAVIGFDYIGRIQQGDIVMNRLNVLAESPIARSAGMLFLPPHGMPSMRQCYTQEHPLEGLREAEVARELASRIGDYRFRDMMGVLFVSLNRWLLGDALEAERVLLASKMPDDAFGYVSSLRPFMLAWICADRGALDEGRSHASRLVQAGQTRNLLVDEGRGHWALGEVLRRMGDWNAANVELETAKSLLSMVCALDVPGVLASLAALRHAEGRSDEALAIAEEALAMYTKTGACSQFFRGAFLRLTHAEILKSLGRNDDACAAIQKARDSILANADKIDVPTLRTSFLENIPENKKTLDHARLWCPPKPESTEL